MPISFAPTALRTPLRSLVLALPIAALACGKDAPEPAKEIFLAAPLHGLQIGTPVFDVPEETEMQHCYYFKLPSDVDLEVVRFEIKYLSGSHHMNLFQTNEDVPDHDEECFTPVKFSSATNPNGYDLIVGSQSGDFDWNMPEGVAFKLKAHRQLLLQTHYVNASTQDSPSGKGQVKVNLHAAEGPVAAHMGTMFANNVNVKIPPRESRSFSTTCGISQDINIVALTGHFHSRGKSFSVNIAPDGATPTDELYRSRDWDEPPFTVLPTPRPLSSGGGLYYTCDFMNPTDKEIVFGPHVETQEHCNLFAYFYPWEEPNTRYCF